MSDHLHLLHYIALKSQELNKGRSPMSQLVLRLSDLTGTHITEAQVNDSIARSIRPNKITATKRKMTSPTGKESLNHYPNDNASLP